VQVLGTISANGFSNGNNDILMMNLNSKGETQFVENMGASISETPGAIVWNKVTSTFTALINTNSITFKDQGGSDWMVYQFDKYGRN
jgi:hypothetical protein